MKTALKLLRGLIFVLLCLVLAVNLWLIGARLLLHQELPKIFGYSQAVVISGSMEPAFSAGDMVIFKDRDSYEAGDVVIFRQGGAFVTHRIAREQDGAFITKGDANNTEDSEPLPPENIEGELVFIIPRIGTVLSFLKTPLGLLILIVSGFALIEVPAMIENSKGKRVKK